MGALPKVVRRLTSNDDPFIPTWCEVYLVEYNDSYYLYITSSIHYTRLKKSGVSYSLDYFRRHSLIHDSHYIELISSFK